MYLAGFIELSFASDFTNLSFSQGRFLLLSNPLIRFFLQPKDGVKNF
jgi:hypothetical protein